MKQRRILVVDDEVAMLEALRAYLEAEGFAVEHAGDGQVAIDKALGGGYDLVLLDLNLPTISGVEVFRAVRERSTVPMIMVTTRGEEIDRVVGLELGADDYVAKPFSPRELVARVKAVLRRSGSARGALDADLQRVGDLEIDRRGHEVRKLGRRLPVTAMEFRILDVLSAHPGRAFTRAALLDKIEEMGSDVFDRTLDRHIANLRRKIEDDPSRPRYIETVVGVGYKFTV
ncbi:MAG TPA: response regulator transcription factor [Candidatus Acidoferrales bacterium]|nr:response regulator transcription factor [Candidatus Acidoferrales bacterium]